MVYENRNGRNHMRVMAKEMSGQDQANILAIVKAREGMWGWATLMGLFQRQAFT